MDKLAKAVPAEIQKDKIEIQECSKPNEKIDDESSSANCKLVPPSLDMKASARDRRRIYLKQVLK